MRYQLAESASTDLREIVAYLAENAGEAIALRMEDELFAHFGILAQHPGIGHRRRDLTPRQLRFFTVDPYLIAYREAEARIIILAVLHGARDVKRLLRSRSE